MRNAVCLGLALSSVLLGCAGEEPAAVPAPAFADVVIQGGVVHTMDASRSRHEALAVRDGKIAAVGAQADLAALIGPQTRVQTFANAMVLPGFHDAHVHPMHGGLEILQCSLTGMESVDAILTKIRECAQREDPWVHGGGWELSLFPDGNAPKELLDEIVPDRPAYFLGADGHSAWANSAALALAGVTADTVAPPLGVIVKDPASGEPTGTLRETAMQLVASHLPPVSDEQRLESLRIGIRIANEFGITSLIDAAVGEPEMRAYASLFDQGALTARVQLSQEYGTALVAAAADFDDLYARRGEFERPLIDTDSIKIFLDGVLEGETAALLEPYNGPRGHQGTLNFEQADLDEAVVRFDRDGVQVHMHAIGDRATRSGLDAVAAARTANGAGRPHHIAHLQLIAPADLPRFGELNVFANFQALWAYPDGYIVNINVPGVGQQRVDRMYPIASVMRAGGTVVGGSDWSVSSMNPVDAIQIALTRQDIGDTWPGVLNEDEAVTLDTMLAAYTIAAARLMGHEQRTGSLEPGKQADVVVLDRDLSTVAAHEIAGARVLLTMLDGKAVYEAPAE